MERWAFVQSAREHPFILPPLSRDWGVWYEEGRRQGSVPINPYDCNNKDPCMGGETCSEEDEAAFITGKGRSHGYIHSMEWETALSQHTKTGA